MCVCKVGEGGGVTFICIYRVGKGGAWLGALIFLSFLSYFYFHFIITNKMKLRAEERYFFLKGKNKEDEERMKEGFKKKIKNKK